MKPITYIALSIAPATALIMYLYLLLRNNKQFGHLLIKAYIAGALAILVLLLSDFISRKLGLTTIRGLEQTLIYSFITVGLGSELGKFLVFRYYILHKPEVDTPIHGIAFSVMTGLGFATVALFLFVFNLYDSRPPYPFNMYILLIVPSTIIFAVILGFFAGMTKFVQSRFIYSLVSIIGATFFHGLYKFCLVTHDYKLLSIFAFGSALVSMVLIMRAVFYRP